MFEGVGDVGFGVLPESKQPKGSKMRGTVAVLLQRAREGLGFEASGLNSCDVAHKT